MVVLSLSRTRARARAYDPGTNFVVGLLNIPRLKTARLHPIVPFVTALQTLSKTKFS